ncbi:hypothetical protein UFOVP1292_8 [uncultured Caudovirales phage]|uniref:Uncharacterized protein n=1 Tax=uncultured Caudovirales phage TaxID=2100421 RepID=A0A6J5P9L1_9CAUD|nr:hypothetical protein UFOVP859_4 [uncultured Caudovirales phage]CAB4168560.1 hypothetical protein UFOVP882_86 [uncultured Caudovirales phage]CAB4196404.1 hypothetical protein UFOVP1292_8 [uncultured Caudovirales phage]CAB4205380.1 hypothetical protein UFOVP1411_82 [uncultured Caudovirales phage]
MLKYVAKRVLVDGVHQWVTVREECGQQEPQSKVEENKTPYSGYSYYGVWEDND